MDSTATASIPRVIRVSWATDGHERGEVIAAPLQPHVVLDGDPNTPAGAVARTVYDALRPGQAMEPRLHTFEAKRMGDVLFHARDSVLGGTPAADGLQTLVDAMCGAGMATGAGATVGATHERVWTIPDGHVSIHLQEADGDVHVWQGEAATLTEPMRVVLDAARAVHRANPPQTLLA